MKQVVTYTRVRHPWGARGARIFEDETKVGSPFDALLRAAESGDWLGDRESNPD